VSAAPGHSMWRASETRRAPGGHPFRRRSSSVRRSHSRASPRLTSSQARSGVTLRIERTGLTRSGDLLPGARLKQRVELVELAAYSAADLFAEVEDAFVRDRVAGVVAVFGAGDHAGVVQDPEVL
jgi:hypothetical protein